MTQSIRQPFIWCAVLIMQLLSLYTPVAVITVGLIMVPPLILYLKLDFKQFSLAYVSSLFVLFLIMGGSSWGLSLILYSLFFIPAAVTMGQLYKKKATIRAVLVSGIVAMIAVSLLFLFLGDAAGLDPVGHMKTIYSDNVALLPESMQKLITTEDIDKIVLALPLLLLLFASSYVWFTHVIARRIMKKSPAPLPGLPPIHTWRLPKSMVWYFLIVMVLGMFVTDKSDTYFQMIVYNLLPLFMLLFIIQSFSLINAFVFHKKWSRIIPFVLVVISIVPPFTYVFCLIGIMDILMPLRERFFPKL